MNQVLICRGFPGCGKSYWAKKNHPGALVVSADSYFKQADGSWRFDPTKLGEAHAQCFHSFISGMRSGEATIVVDNTGTEAYELAPYVLGAAAHGYLTRIVEFRPPEFMSFHEWAWRCFKANTHGVPRLAHERMVRKFQDAELPFFWTIERVEGAPHNNVKL